MDWSKAKVPVQPAPDPPAATLVEVCWHMRAPSGRVITCGIYQDSAPGLDVRAQFSDDDLLRSERAPEIGAARDVAAKWKASVLLKGGFDELSEGQLQ